MAKLTKEKVTTCLKGSALTLATLLGVIGGIIFGICLRQREGMLRIIGYPFVTLFARLRFPGKY